MALPLTGVVRRYAWGSPTAIPALLGIEPDGMPAAELWLGAHPSDPSVAVVDGVPVRLDTLLARERHLLAGHDSLPFLVKVLAAERTLSLQVHPDRQQAAEGHARGETDAAGLPRYLDPHHKPELIVALTPFRALSGTRPAAEAAAVAAALDVPDLRVLCAPLHTAAGSLVAQGEALRTVLRDLLALPAPRRTALVAAVVSAAARVRASGRASRHVLRYADLVGVLADDHPGDIGIVAALLLNDLDLAPGEALFQPAGVIHAYVRGTGVEVMASSDNVLRCGLTPKPLDHEGLFRVLDPRPVPPQRPRIGAEPWAAPCGDFWVARLDCTGEPLAVAEIGPAIVLCTSGSVIVRDGEELALGRGEAAFVSVPSPWTLDGYGEAFVASVVPALVAV